MTQGSEWYLRSTCADCSRSWVLAWNEALFLAKEQGVSLGRVIDRFPLEPRWLEYAQATAPFARRTRQELIVCPRCGGDRATREWFSFEECDRLPRDIYKAMIHQVVTAALKPHGYRRQGTTFRKYKGGYWGLITFQASSRNTRESAQFCVEVAVTADRFRVLRGREWWDDEKGPTRAGMWLPLSIRLGFLSDGWDTWWRVYPGSQPEEIAEYVLPSIVDLAVPLIDSAMSDEGLREHLWRVAMGEPKGFLPHTSILIELLEEHGEDERIDKLRAFAEDRAKS